MNDTKDDLIARLSAYAEHGFASDHKTDCVEAASIIARLRAETEKLREALEPFAKEADDYDQPEGDDNDPAWIGQFTVGAFRRARNSLRRQR